MQNFDYNNPMGNFSPGSMDPGHIERNIPSEEPKITEKGGKSIVSQKATLSDGKQITVSLKYNGKIDLSDAKIQEDLEAAMNKIMGLAEAYQLGQPGGSKKIKITKDDAVKIDKKLQEKDDVEKTLTNKISDRTINEQQRIRIMNTFTSLFPLKTMPKLSQEIEAPRPMPRRESESLKQEKPASRDAQLESIVIESNESVQEKILSKHPHDLKVKLSEQLEKALSKVKKTAADFLENAIHSGKSQEADEKEKLSTPIEDLPISSAQPQKPAPPLLRSSPSHKKQPLENEKQEDLEKLTLQDRVGVLKEKSLTFDEAKRVKKAIQNEIFPEAPPIPAFVPKTPLTQSKFMPIHPPPQLKTPEPEVISTPVGDIPNIEIMDSDAISIEEQDLGPPPSYDSVMEGEETITESEPEVISTRVGDFPDIEVMDTDTEDEARRESISSLSSSASEVLLSINPRNIKQRSLSNENIKNIKSLNKEKEVDAQKLQFILTGINTRMFGSSVLYRKFPSSDEEPFRQALNSALVYQKSRRSTSKTEKKDLEKSVQLHQKTVLIYKTLAGQELDRFYSDKASDSQGDYKVMNNYDSKNLTPEEKESLLLSKTLLNEILEDAETLAKKYEKSSGVTQFITLSLELNTSKMLKEVNQLLQSPTTLAGA